MIPFVLKDPVERHPVSDNLPKCPACHRSFNMESTTGIGTAVSAGLATASRSPPRPQLPRPRGRAGSGRSLDDGARRSRHAGCFILHHRWLHTARRGRAGRSRYARWWAGAYLRPGARLARHPIRHLTDRPGQNLPRRRPGRAARRQRVRAGLSPDLDPPAEVTGLNPGPLVARHPNRPQEPEPAQQIHPIRPLRRRHTSCGLKILPATGPTTPPWGSTSFDRPPKDWSVA